MDKPSLNLTRYKLYSLLREKMDDNLPISKLLDFLLQLLYDVEDDFIANNESLNLENFRKRIVLNFETASRNIDFSTEKTTTRLIMLYKKSLDNFDKNDTPSKQLNKLMNFVTEISAKSFDPKDFAITEEDKKSIDHTNQVFLSYAHDDQLLTLSYYELFKAYGVFLYVDWMNNGIISDGDKLKKTLHKAMKESKQLLFLRSLNSELDLKGSSNVRQWCSWEIGNYYCISPKEKFYTAMYDMDIRSKGVLNTMLSTFRPLKKISVSGMS